MAIGAIAVVALLVAVVAFLTLRGGDDTTATPAPTTTAAATETDPAPTQTQTEGETETATEPATDAATTGPTSEPTSEPRPTSSLSKDPNDVLALANGGNNCYFEPDWERSSRDDGSFYFQNGVDSIAIRRVGNYLSYAFVQSADVNPATSEQPAIEAAASAQGRL